MEFIILLIAILFIGLILVLHISNPEEEPKLTTDQKAEIIQLVAKAINEGSGNFESYGYGYIQKITLRSRNDNERYFEFLLLLNHLGLKIEEQTGKVIVKVKEETKK